MSYPRLVPTRALAIALAAIGLAGPAAAAPISSLLSVTATGFTDLTGQNPGVAAASLTISVAFDPAAGDQFDNPIGVTLVGGTLTAAGGLLYDYDSVLDELTIGGALTGVAGIAAGTDDVLITIDGASTATPTLAAFDYVSVQSTGIFESLTGTVAAPEPALGGLALAALATLGLFRRRA